MAAFLCATVLVRSIAAADISAPTQPSLQKGPPPASLSRGESSETLAPAGQCEDGVQDSGAKYRICMPWFGWNGDLVVYAHGYVAPDRPVEIPEDQMSLPGSSWTIDQLVNLYGYAFATTSYYTNGLAVLPAVSDLLDLVDVFAAEEGTPDRVYLAGVSEGGLITALSVEQHPDIYDGGLAMCGPYGDFQGQTDHFGDFRVVFDYFFPGLMPGSAVSIPDGFLETWRSGYFTTTIEPEVADPANAGEVDQLLNVTGVSPYAYAPPTSTNSIEEVLGYNVFATNDAVAKLGGQPFDNQDRVYTGSDDDAQLNEDVQRFTADQAALDEIEANYQTSGQLSVPMVTVHTTGDPVVPYWHASLYEDKVVAAGTAALYQHVEVDRHGHCNFTQDEVLNAFFALVDMVENPLPDLVASQPQPSSSSPFDPGQTVDWSVRVTNQGAGAAPATHVAYYLGTRCDDLSTMVGSHPVAPLDPGAYDDQIAPYTFQEADAGALYLIARADDQDEEPNEANENNNVGCYGPFLVKGACWADIDGDGDVDVGDVLLVAVRWRQPAEPPYDVDGDGIVTVVDIMMVAAEWGSCP
jgi:pimeloyl-ACP methyl ester carboxylesterase